MKKSSIFSIKSRSRDPHKIKQMTLLLRSTATSVSIWPRNYITNWTKKSSQRYLIQPGRKVTITKRCPRNLRAVFALCRPTAVRYNSGRRNLGTAKLIKVSQWPKKSSRCVCIMAISVRRICPKNPTKKVDQREWVMQYWAENKFPGPVKGHPEQQS